MKKLVLATLLCGSVAQLGGCIIVGDDDGGNPPPTPPDAMEPEPDANPEPIPSAIVVSWTLLGGDPVGGVQSEVTCPPDIVSVNITADPNPDVDGDEDIYKYNCVDGVTDPEELPPATYDVWVELEGPGGSLVAQSDLVQGAVLAPEDLLELEFTFSVDRGTIGLAWTIADATSGDPLTCDDLGADSVELLLTVANTPDESDAFLLDCADGKGESDPLLLLTEYVASLSLVYVGPDVNDTSDDIVFDTAEPIPALTLEYGNDHIDLGDVLFEVAQ